MLHYGHYNTINDVIFISLTEMASKTFRIHFPSLATLLRSPPPERKLSHDAISTIFPLYVFPRRELRKSMLARDGDATPAVNCAAAGFRGEVYCKLIFKLRKPRRGTRAPGTLRFAKLRRACRARESRDRAPDSPIGRIGLFQHGGSPNRTGRIQFPFITT